MAPKLKSLRSKSTAGNLTKSTPADNDVPIPETDEAEELLESVLLEKTAAKVTPSADKPDVKPTPNAEPVYALGIKNSPISIHNALSVPSADPAAIGSAVAGTAAADRNTASQAAASPETPMCLEPNHRVSDTIATTAPTNVSNSMPGTTSTKLPPLPASNVPATSGLHSRIETKTDAQITNSQDKEPTGGGASQRGCLGTKLKL